MYISGLIYLYEFCSSVSMEIQKASKDSRLVSEP